MRKALPQSFFNRPTVEVARDLIGKYIVRRVSSRVKTNDGAVRELALMITETEAYDGPRDLASHASRGRTPRTTVMFRQAGNFYVYFTYGMHWLVNIVTGADGYPAAVLLRAGIWINPATGAPVAIDGPARLTKFLGITGAENNRPAGRSNGLWFEDRGTIVSRRNIIASPRIGVDYAGPVWSNKPYRFQLNREAAAANGPMKRRRTRNQKIAGEKKPRHMHPGLTR